MTEPEKPEESEKDVLEELFRSFGGDRKIITLTFSQEEGTINITHDRMNGYEALGLLMTAVDLIRSDLTLEPIDVEEDEENPE